MEIKHKSVDKGQPTSKYSDDDRTIVWVMTTETTDRDGETVNPLGGDFSDFAKNPTVQWNHDTDDFPIGSLKTRLAGPPPQGKEQVHPDLAMWYDKVGEGTEYPEVGGPERDALLGRVYFSQENAAGDKAYRMAKEGTLGGGSISFLPKGSANKNRGGGNHYDKWKLLEWTICPVGSNPDSIALSKSLKAARERAVKKVIDVDLVAAAVKATQVSSHAKMQAVRSYLSSHGMTSRADQDASIKEAWKARKITGAPLESARNMSPGDLEAQARLGPDANFGYLILRSVSVPKNKFADPDEVSTSGFPKFVSDADDRERLEQQAPVQLRAWRDAYKKLHEASGLTARTKVRPVLEAAWKQLKAAWERLDRKKAPLAGHDAPGPLDPSKFQLEQGDKVTARTYIPDREAGGVFARSGDKLVIVSGPPWVARNREGKTAIVAGLAEVRKEEESPARVEKAAMPRDQWLSTLDEILTHTKGTTHADYDQQKVEQLYAEGALPKQAAMALVVSSKSLDAEEKAAINYYGGSYWVTDDKGRELGPFPSRTAAETAAMQPAKSVVEEETEILRSLATGEDKGYIDAFKDFDVAKKAAYEAGKAAKGSADPQAEFTKWLRAAVTNAGNSEVYFLQREFGRGYQGKSKAVSDAPLKVQVQAWLFVHGYEFSDLRQMGSLVTADIDNGGNAARQAVEGLKKEGYAAQLDGSNGIRVMQRTQGGVMMSKSLHGPSYTIETYQGKFWIKWEDGYEDGPYADKRSAEAATKLGNSKSKGNKMKRKIWTNGNKAWVRKSDMDGGMQEYLEERGLDDVRIEEEAPPAEQVIEESWGIDADVSVQQSGSSWYVYTKIDGKTSHTGPFGSEDEANRAAAKEQAKYKSEPGTDEWVAEEMAEPEHQSVGKSKKKSTNPPGLRAINEALKVLDEQFADVEKAEALSAADKARTALKAARDRAYKDMMASEEEEIVEQSVVSKAKAGDLKKGDFAKLGGEMRKVESVRINNGMISIWADGQKYIRDIMDNVQTATHKDGGDLSEDEEKFAEVMEEQVKTKADELVAEESVMEDEAVPMACGMVEEMAKSKGVRKELLAKVRKHVIKRLVTKNPGDDRFRVGGYIANKESDGKWYLFSGGSQQKPGDVMLAGPFGSRSEVTQAANARAAGNRQRTGKSVDDQGAEQEALVDRTTGQRAEVEYMNGQYWVMTASGDEHGPYNSEAEAQRKADEVKKTPRRKKLSKSDREEMKDLADFLSDAADNAPKHLSAGLKYHADKVKRKAEEPAMPVVEEEPVTMTPDEEQQLQEAAAMMVEESKALDKTLYKHTGFVQLNGNRFSGLVRK